MAKVYLLDIEGTVAPLSLTTEVLFPYARSHFEPFLCDQFGPGGPQDDAAGRDAAGHEGPFEGVRGDLRLLNLENLAERDPEAPRILLPGPDPGSMSMSPAKGIPRILAYIYWLMDHDRKSTALKSLQGKIWRAGFESGELKGTLFPDVPDAFARWSRSGRVAIYSSGSVEAQQLLFRHSVFGDLTPMIAAYFDTRTGAKIESSSYRAIAQAMHSAPADLLFFSDSVRELDAAREAGSGTRLVTRPGNPSAFDTNQHTTVASFDAL